MTSRYARFPVFLNRTIEGPEKRRGLEEAKPLAYTTTASGEVARLDDSTSPSMLSNIAYQHDSLRQHVSADNRLLVQPTSSTVLDQQLISNFWEKYIPADARTQGLQSPCLWLKQIIALPNRGQALQLSLKALALTRLGFVTNDESMARQGSINYVGALQLVQRDLQCEDLVMRDDLFLAGYTLAIYEVSRSLFC